MVLSKCSAKVCASDLVKSRNTFPNDFSSVVIGRIALNLFREVLEFLINSKFNLIY